MSKPAIKSKLWIPAALCAMALLTAVSMLAPKSITGVSAADDVSGSDASIVTQSDQGNTGSTDNPGNTGDTEDPDLSDYSSVVIGVDANDFAMSIDASPAYYKVGSGEQAELLYGHIVTNRQPLTVYTKTPIKKISFSGSVEGVDISELTDLEELNVSNCGLLSSLDVSENTKLKKLTGNDSSLTSLDLSHNPALESLEVMQNQLESLDLSHNPNLKELYCNGNNLSELDVTGNTALKTLHLSSNDVGDLDLSKNTALTELGCYGCGLSELDLSKNTALSKLECSSNSIAQLDLSKNTALTELSACENGIGSIDLSKNTALKSVNLSQNNLKTIDFSKNTKLESIYLIENELKTLDLSKNTALKHLDVDYNDFETFDSIKYPSGYKSVLSESSMPIPGMDETPKEVKAGEVIDLSKYKSCGSTKSYCDLELMTYDAEDDYYEFDMKTAIPESDNDMKIVIGNAYANKVIQIVIHNDASDLCFRGLVKILNNPDAPAAPAPAEGDIPVEDPSGTITEAESTKDFAAHGIVYDNNKYALGDPIEKENLKLSISKVSQIQPLADKIAAADKTFNKGKAKLFAYDINLECTNHWYEYIKLDNGMNLTLAFPSDIAKDWEKYNFKVYHFADFDYKNMTANEEPKVESVAAKVDKDGIHITAPGFSKYVISATPKSAGGNNPGTGDNNLTLNIVLLVILFSAAGITGVFAKRKGELA